ncbi:MULTISPECIES: hypothetical protein [unclassified Sinorhizobium]|uniref:hypothetical protein n=1 Tax=unclassified Sinorhizobium TaxID=2613772 RepID=UPI0024C3F7C3|nr:MULTISPECIES: hypothetical protein [unclassified Sinorhizobium]MDK1376504.1 hypothetical protein [Sinorhizobium sp. 6-70]MDK1481941.1 hypothetical protein [Sinorhizobium sp. 6-117]
MATSKEHIDNLLRLRRELVERRRAVASNREPGEIVATAKGVIEFQMSIEAIDRAIDDEKRLHGASVAPLDGVPKP